jgi:hypothetical protein
LVILMTRCVLSQGAQLYRYRYQYLCEHGVCFAGKPAHLSHLGSCCRLFSAIQHRLGFTKYHQGLRPSFIEMILLTITMLHHQTIYSGRLKHKVAASLLTRYGFKERTSTSENLPLFQHYIHTAKFHALGLGVVFVTHLRASAAAQESLHWLLSSVSPRSCSTSGGVECALE